MTYQEAIANAMQMLAADPLTRFVGYCMKYGSMANGTMKGINPDQMIETPVAENLMAGLATGLAIAGFKPVLWIERFDFVLNALDSIVNHLDKLPTISCGEFRPKVIIRTNVGGKKHPLFSGPTHTQDFTEALRCMVSFPVYQVRTPDEVTKAYTAAQASPDPCMVVEYRDSYQH